MAAEEGINFSTPLANQRTRLTRVKPLKWKSRLAAKKQRSGCQSAAPSSPAQRSRSISPPGIHEVSPRHHHPCRSPSLALSAVASSTPDLQIGGREAPEAGRDARLVGSSIAPPPASRRLTRDEKGKSRVGEEEQPRSSRLRRQRSPDERPDAGRFADAGQSPARADSTPDRGRPRARPSGWDLQPHGTPTREATPRRYPPASGWNSDLGGLSIHIKNVLNGLRM